MSRLRLACTIVFVCGVFTSAGFIAASMLIQDAHAATQCRTVKTCHAALRWHRGVERGLRRQLRVHFNRDATYAVRLASAAFGLPYRQMRCIAQRESGMGAQRYAESSSGASGLYQFLPSTWRHTPFASFGFSIWDPIASALAAGQLIKHDGSARQWVTGAGCGL